MTSEIADLIQAKAQKIGELLAEYPVAQVKELTKNYANASCHTKQSMIDAMVFNVAKLGSHYDTSPKPGPKPKKAITTKLPEDIQALVDNIDSLLAIPEGQVSDGQLVEAHTRVGSKQKSGAFIPDNASRGILEIHQSGYGFVRTYNYEASPRNDVYVPIQVIKAYGLRNGDCIVCSVKDTKEGGNFPVDTIYLVNEFLPDRVRRRPYFDDLTPLYPSEKIKLEIEGANNNLSLRCIDIIAPIGKGQRGLIVSPPKAGKTTLLKLIAQSIESNYPEIKLIVLLVDERPEEVTDLRRSIKSEVVSSTFDEEPAHHLRAAELVVSRAKRLVELGFDVVVLLDSITKLTRASNYAIESSGRTLSGGIDPTALYGPKKFFGAARNIEEGGSLTILATALIDTGSRMDDFIYEEFKGTGNMELHLSRELQEKRIFPAIDLFRSGTRKEELLLSDKELECAFSIRRILSRDGAAENLLDMMKKTRSNAEFVVKMEEWMKLYQASSRNTYIPNNK